MKILIYTAFHNRPAISEIFWWGIYRLQKNFNVEVLAVTSDMDNALLAEQYSDYHISTVNKPLGAKMNKGLEVALTKDFDFMMQLGSDDLISDELVLKSIATFESGCQFFGVNNFILFDSVKKVCKHFKYNNIMGAGRCISKELLLKASQRVEVIFTDSMSGGGQNWDKGQRVFIPLAIAEKMLDVVNYTGEFKIMLWDDDRECAMDTNSAMKIEELGIVPIAVETEQPGIIDIKSAENIWSYDTFDCEEQPLEIMKNICSEKEIELMMAL